MSYDPGAISRLFSADVAYRYHPNDMPIVGRAAVVASWFGQDTSGDASTRMDLLPRPRVTRYGQGHHLALSCPWCGSWDELGWTDGGQGG
jgi:hypothetical protein